MTQSREEIATARLRRFGKPLLSAAVLGLVAMAAVAYFSTGEQTWHHLRRFTPRYVVACFGLVAMAWYGVNFLLGTGLHTFGFGTGGGTIVFASLTLQGLFLTLATLRHALNNLPPPTFHPPRNQTV